MRGQSYTPEKTDSNRSVYGVTSVDNDICVDNKNLIDNNDNMNKVTSNLPYYWTQNGVKDLTSDCVTYDFCQGGPGYEYYPQDSQYSIIDSNDFSRLANDMLGHCFEAVDSYGNCMEAVNLQVLDYDSNCCDLGFEYYPQVSQAASHGVSHASLGSSYRSANAAVTHDVELGTHPVIRVLDSQYKHSHTAVIYNLDEHGVGHNRPPLGVGGEQGNRTVGCMLQVTNFLSFHVGIWAPVVHIQAKSSYNLSGFYIWIQAPAEGDSTLIPHAHPPEGFFNVIDIIYLHVVSVCPARWGLAPEQHFDPGLVYDNYCKDCRSWQYYDCSYEEYMTAIIDTMIDVVGQLPDEGKPLGSIPEVDHYDIEQNCMIYSSEVAVPSITCTYDNTSVSIRPNGGFPDKARFQSSGIPPNVRDFNYPNKVVSYLAQESTEFEFIGPDRCPMAITTLPQLLDIADIIRDTGLPNYQGARIPIISGLNVKAWESHLQGYSDKRILQYIKFGFPLSLMGAENYITKRLLTIIQLASILKKYKSTLTKKLHLGLY